MCLPLGYANSRLRPAPVFAHACRSLANFWPYSRGSYPVPTNAYRLCNPA